MRPVVRAAAILMLAAAGCTAAPASVPPTPTPAVTPKPTLVSRTPEPASWATDLAQIDDMVRTAHPSPWAIHREEDWEAALARVGAALEAATTATPNEQLVLVSELMGLLDTHSAVVDIPGSWHFYELLPYRFSDGWFIVRAADESLVGSQLISIGGVPIEDVVERLTLLVPHDNPNGALMNLLWLINNVEYLNGAGFVPDVDHPAFELRSPEGAVVIVDPGIVDVPNYHLVNPGWLNGPAPEAVARRGEYIWTRLILETQTFLIAANDYGDMTAQIAELTAALDAGEVDRVVYDLRYLPGGNGDIQLLETLMDDPRINRPGGLIALIGRENVSVATQVVYFLDQTEALLVGEATPARASNFTCPCHDVTLRHSGIVVSVPTSWDYPGDERSEIAPDVPMSLSAVDFFAGRDPVLEAVLNGTLPTAAP